MQRKLTEENAKRIGKAADIIAQAFSWVDTGESREYWEDVYGRLKDKATNRTSDGKPYIEPEPPIPEGYRKALDSEHCREDVKIWDKDKKQWGKRLFPSQPFLNGDRYIVPVDTPLTDQDACVWPRLLVMVRDSTDLDWIGPFPFLGIGSSHAHLFIIDDMGKFGSFWKQARRATPEEIKAAK